MAQLNSSVVQGSLRVTDTTYTTNANISSLTASQAVITDANKNLISRNIYNKTTVGNLEWTSAANDIHLVTKNTLAYWNGLYNASSSNLTYCNKGAFGDMAIKTKGNGFSDSSNTISVAYGTGANTALQGNQILFKLNNADKTAASPASFYAPTTGGTKYQILISDGIAAPVWTAAATLDSATNATSGTAAYTNLTLGNNVNVSSATAHSEGKITLYSAATKAHIIQGQSTTNDFTHTLPNSTGWFATGGNGSDSGVGTSNIPIYLKTDGTLAAITSYDGNAATATKWAAAQTTYVNLANASTSTSIQGGSSNAAVLGVDGVLEIANGGTGTFGQADHMILIGTGTSLGWRVLDGSDLTTAIQYQTDAPASTDVVPGTIWLRPTSVSIEDLKCLVVQLNNISGDGTQPVIARYNSSSINQHMVVVGYSISNPAAVTGDLTWNTSDANPTLTVQGYINGNTNIILYLLPERGE